MVVKKVGEKYRCNICGNKVTVTSAGGGELVCCGQPMEKIEGWEIVATQVQSSGVYDSGLENDWIISQVSASSAQVWK